MHKVLPIETNHYGTQAILYIVYFCCQGYGSQYKCNYCCFVV